MRKLLSALIVCGTVAAAWGQTAHGQASANSQLPLLKVAGRQVAAVRTQPTFGVRPQQKLAVAKTADQLAASFTIRGAEGERQVAGEDFEASAAIPAGWTADPTTKVTWSLKKAPVSYSDAPNERSLFVDGDYRVYNREISSVTTAAFQIPTEAMLHAQVYCSLNYDDCCRLIISASHDGFAADSTVLWNSKDAAGPKSICWRTVDASLAAYGGKTVQLRFTYSWGSKDEIFKKGGYLGSFYIDGISITAPAAVESLSVTTGDKIELVDTSSGDIAAWQWTMPGAVPSSSADRNPVIHYTRDGRYDVSLTVTDSAGNQSTFTRPEFVSVTGTAPTAKMAISDGFRSLATLNPVVAPLTPVAFVSASQGFPTEHWWTFSKFNDNTGALVTEQRQVGDSVSKAFEYLHDWAVELEVSNQHGTSKTAQTVSAEYSASITNFRSGDVATTFDMEGLGTFPGTNQLKITKFAEKFSRPTVPVVVEGVNVYFAKAKAEQLADQVSMITARLCASEDGKPGRTLDFMSWMVVELDASSDLSKATWFPFTDRPVVNDEFFIVIDGFADLYSDTEISMYMADFRDAHNTAYMYKNDQWVDVSTYFPAGRNHTSLMVVPVVHHSVMASATGAEPVLNFGEAGGTQTFALFSYLGYKAPIESGSDWCRVISEPNGMTVDELTVQCDPMPAGIYERTATLSPTDGSTVYPITVVQQRTNAVAVTEAGDLIIVEGNTVRSADGRAVTLYNLQGQTISTGPTVKAPAPGLYIAVSATVSRKVSIK